MNSDFSALWWMLGILAIAIIIAVLSKTTIANKKGKEGENSVRRILSQLPRKKFIRLNNVVLRNKYGITIQIDHVVIGAYGIFVIETKNYLGKISGTDESEHWSQLIYGNTHNLYNPVLQNRSHIAALKDSIKDAVPEWFPYVSIVAFESSATLDVTAETAYVVGWKQIPDIINQFSDVNLQPDCMQRIAHAIRSAQVVGHGVKHQHIADVKANIERKQQSVAEGKCPRCGGDLVLRHGQYGDFYGCSNYPNCKYIQSCSPQQD